jgi:hypothetical protein
MALRLLTLDATGTIFKFRRPPVEEYVAVASIYGFKLEEARVRSQFKNVLKKMEKEHPHFGATSQLDSMKWWIKVVQETHIGMLLVPNPKALLKYQYKVILLTMNAHVVRYTSYCRSSTCNKALVSYITPLKSQINMITLQ